MSSHPSCRIVLVGDSSAGKSCLLQVFEVGDSGTDAYIPTFSNYYYFDCLIPLDHPISPDVRQPAPIKWEKWRQQWGWPIPTEHRTQGHRDLKLTIVPNDTPGLHAYTQSRSFAYGNIDVVALCVAINAPTTLQNVCDMWLPELKHHIPDAPIVLIGCKLDLRTDDTSPECITPDQGAEMARRIGACAYMECSARTKENVERVFQFLTWSGAQKILATRKKGIIEGCITL